MGGRERNKEDWETVGGKDDHGKANTEENGEDGYHSSLNKH